MTYRTVLTKHVDQETPNERVYEDLCSSEWYNSTYHHASAAHDKFKQHHPEEEDLDFTVIAIGLESGSSTGIINSYDFRRFSRDVFHRQH